MVHQYCKRVRLIRRMRLKLADACSVNNRLNHGVALWHYHSASEEIWNRTSNGGTSWFVAQNTSNTEQSRLTEAMTALCDSVRAHHRRLTAPRVLLISWSECHVSPCSCVIIVAFLVDVILLFGFALYLAISYTSSREALRRFKIILRFGYPNRNVALCSLCAARCRRSSFL